MARVVITPHEMGRVNEAMTAVTTASLFVAVDASAGAEFAMSGRDDKTLLLVQNAATSAKTVTVKAGNGIQGVNDEVLSVPAGINLIKLESGRFKFVTGDNKGKIVLKAAASGVQYGIVALI